MAIYNLGSINQDMIYRVEHLPMPGETLKARQLSKGLGGKGANQSAAMAFAGCQVKHIGALGKDGAGLRTQLEQFGVDTTHIINIEEPTGQAIIYVDDLGENSIVLYTGANAFIGENLLEHSLSQACFGDWFVCQNETNMTARAAQIARQKGLKTVYSAAPFEIHAVEQILEWIDLIVINEIEANQLFDELSNADSKLSGIDMLMTKSDKGAHYFSKGRIATKSQIKIPAYRVDPIDTTGAGDTYLGYFLCEMSQGHNIEQAMRVASAAAALQITRPGASAAIPRRDEVIQFMQVR